MRDSIIASSDYSLIVFINAVKSSGCGYLIILTKTISIIVQNRLKFTRDKTSFNSVPSISYFRVSFYRMKSGLIYHKYCWRIFRKIS